jgi:flavin-dependent dehydrogenase
MQPANLRRMLEAFCEVYAPAGELMRDGSLQGEIKGAPLRCSMRGALTSRPGLLATGEALGSTYAFSGEGIGKAMETGMLAAQVLVSAAAATGKSDASVQADYTARLGKLQPMFDLYERASWVNQHPWLADLVIWRARRSPAILRRLTGVLEETQNPGNLFTLRGLRKMMFE